MNKYSIEYWIEKGYSEKDSIDKIKSIRREESWQCVEFWIKRGYSKNEAIKIISEKQKEINKKRDYTKNCKNPYSKEYYIEKGVIDENEINRLIKEMKDKKNPYLKWSENELQEVIKKRKKTYYNKTENERKEINKSRGLNRKQLFEKFGDVKAVQILLNRGKGTRSPYEKRFSKISIELFDKIQELNPLINFKYGKDEEFIVIKNLKNKKGVFVDFLYSEEKKIIEFNGDFWHFNPKKYVKESFVVLNGIKVVAKDVWENEAIKIERLKQLGYDVLVIWEADYLNDKNNIIIKCNNFINNEKIY